MRNRIALSTKSKIVGFLKLEFPKTDGAIFSATIDFINLYYKEIKKNKGLKKVDPLQSDIFEMKPEPMNLFDD